MLKRTNELSRLIFAIFLFLLSSSLLDVWTGLPVPVLPGLGEARAGHPFGPAGPAGGAGHQGGARGARAPQPHHWSFPCKATKAEDQSGWWGKIVPLSAFLFFDEEPIRFSVFHSILMWCGGMPAGLWTVYNVFGPDSGWGLCLLAWWWEGTRQHVPTVRRRRRVWPPDWRGHIGYRLRDKLLQVQPWCGCFDVFIEPIKTILDVFNLKVLCNTSGCELLRNENGFILTFLHFSEIVF